MDNSIAAQIHNVQVKFQPPLHEQRRAWVLDALRRESVTSVRTLSVEVASTYPLIVSLTGAGRRLRRGYPPAASHSYCAVARLLVLDSRPGCI